MVRVWPCARGEAGDDAARAAQRGDTCAGGNADALSQHVPARTDDSGGRMPPGWQILHVSGGAARAKLTTFARTAGGIICTTSPARDGLTPTGRTDSATTFDSPFPANLLAVWDWESLFLPASGQGGRFLMAFQGILCIIPPVLRAGAVPRRPLPVFFWPGIFCTQNFVCKGHGLNRRRWAAI